MSGACLAGSLGDVQHERQTGALLPERSLEQQEKIGSARRSTCTAGHRLCRRGMRGVCLAGSAVDLRLAAGGGSVGGAGSRQAEVSGGAISRSTGAALL